MDYENLSPTELIALLEQKDSKIEELEENIRDETLTVPDTSTAVTLYNLHYGVSLDSDIEGTENLVKESNKLLDGVVHLADESRSEYLSAFSRAVSYANKNSIDNDDWSPEAWFREGIQIDIQPYELIASFMRNSSTEQRTPFFESYFTLDETLKNKPSSYNLGFSVNPYNIRKTFEYIIERGYNSHANKFENISTLYDFVTEKNRAAEKELKASIKSLITRSVQNDYNKGLMIENLKFDNKFDIQPEDLNLRNFIENLNGKVSRYKDGDSSSIAEDCSFLEKLVNGGVWDKQIAEYKQDNFTQNPSINAAIFHVEDVLMRLLGPAKERFDNIVDQRYLTLSTENTLDNENTQKRKGPSI